LTVCGSTNEAWPGENVDVVVVEVGRDPEPQIAHERVRLRQEIPQSRPFVQLKVDAPLADRHE
jgi:hypothetical protein